MIESWGLAEEVGGHPKGTGFIIWVLGEGTPHERVSILRREAFKENEKHRSEVS